ncbi:hypothetical protein CW751_08870 [Brumimicrobium salinarum]|uniref:Uncharacterized protein n=1 Tax=Brumimicrobium salinarum TaxID=2058658 RepID=A0A2I0R1N3_9FLAO|nr:hypothetical protein [Brumimicrobium salinarum]PKR80479.1 hypothetical protein CW751_08870 [Brumimicrobium salinarum]
MIGIISTQISILKYEILNSPYKGYLTIKTCHNATKLAERDFNNGRLKYFQLGDFKDTTLLNILENKNIQIIDLTSFNAEHLECNNSITTLSLSQYSPVQ